MLREKIDSFHIQDIQNEIHPSVFFEHEDYDLFILRLPNGSDENKPVYRSHAFIVTDENQYFYYDKEKDEFIDLQNMKGFYKFINKHIDKLLKTISYYVDSIDEIEDRIYDGKSLDDFNKKWFIFKSELVRMNRSLNKALDTLNIFINHYKNDEDYLERNFEDALEHIQRAYRNTGLLLEKLDSIYNFNLNQTNEQMNRVVYILTLLSGIFLPLNLIVGFFGMNTTELPFTQGGHGTFNVLLVLSIATVLASLITLFLRKKY